MIGSLVFTQMHKKAFDDWAYSAPPYLAGLEGRGGREETKGGGNYRQDTSSPLPTIPGSATVVSY